MSHRLSWPLALVSVISLCLATASSGCSTARRGQILSLFFDGVNATAKPPTQRVRRDLQREVDDLKQQVAVLRAEAEQPRGRADTPTEPASSAARPIEQARMWEEADALLPKHAAGGVDWDAALSSGAIAPGSGPRSSQEVAGGFDLDVELDTSGSRVFRASFAHAGHNRWVGCQSCHPAMFPVGSRTARPVVTMASLSRRQFCGTCHGPVAFRVEGACSRCHPALPQRLAWVPVEPPRTPLETVHRWEEAQRMLPSSDGSTEWTKALAAGTIRPRADLTPAASVQEGFASDVEWRSDAGEEFRAVFPHSAHTAWLTCGSCHPQPFSMQAGSTPMSMDAINAGQFCGTCHGTVSFPLGACARCHPAMEAGP